MGSRCLAAFVGFVTLCLPLNVWTSFAHEGDPHREEDPVVLTNQLLHHSRKFLHAPHDQQGHLLEQMADITARRRTRLFKEIETDPGAFLRHALPPQARVRIPGEIRDWVEEHVQVTGRWTTLIEDDFVKGRSRVYHLLESKDSSGRTYTVHFARSPTDVTPGSEVMVSGVSLGTQLILESGAAPSLQTTSAASYPAVAGDQKVVLLLVNFLDKSVSFSKDYVHSVVFTHSTSVNRVYQEISFNQMSFSGDVFGPFTIPYNMADGRYLSLWADAADTAATEAGINVDNYGRKVYVLAGDPGLGFGSWWGSPPRAWIFGCFGIPSVDSHLFSHELGHTFGMQHASTPEFAYGDDSDFMGGGTNATFPCHVNGPHKIQMGWVPPTDVTDGGTYTIALLETAQPEPQVLRIAKPDTEESYYLSYRRPVGSDVNLQGTTLIPYLNRTNVHRWGGQMGRETYFLSALADGVQFADSTNGITIEQLRHDTTRATVSVTMAHGMCAPAAPQLTILPLSQTGAPGQALTYTLSIKNMDTLSCINTTFQLSATVPEGWSSTFSPGSIQLAPGATGSVSWQVTSPQESEEASYPISIEAGDVNDSSHAASTEGTAVILIPNRPPVVESISPNSGSSNRGVEVTFTTTVTDPDGWEDIRNSFLLVNSMISTANGACVRYNQNENKLYLRNDDGTAWKGGYAPGSANVIVNSYAKLNCAGTTVTGSGETLTVDWRIAFRGAFSGKKNCYLRATDEAGLNTGWVKKGTWNVN